MDGNSSSLNAYGVLKCLPMPGGFLTLTGDLYLFNAINRMFVVLLMWEFVINSVILLISNKRIGEGGCFKSSSLSIFHN